MQERIESEQIQVNQLIEKLNGDFKVYYSELNNILDKYKHVVKFYNPETESLYIGADGHMWIIKKDKLKAK